MTAIAENRPARRKKFDGIAQHLLIFGAPKPNGLIFMLGPFIINFKIGSFLFTLDEKQHSLPMGLGQKGGVSTTTNQNAVFTAKIKANVSALSRIRQT
jgi:hypothetical protein